MEKNYFLLNCLHYSEIGGGDMYMAQTEPLLENNRWAMKYHKNNNPDYKQAWTAAKKIKPGDVVFLYTNTRNIYAYGYVIDKRKKEYTNKNYQDEFLSDDLNGDEENGFVKDSVFFVDNNFDWPHQLEVDYFRIVDNGTVACKLKLVGQTTITQIESKDYSEAERVMKEIDKQDYYQKLVTTVEKCKNVIFSGSPGTGKTYVAHLIAKRLVSQNTYKEENTFIGFVQFHPSYDYTDFVEGLRPVKTSKNESSSEINFERQDGVFKSFCKKAKDDLDNRYVFIIDEINRGDLSKIFGELFFSIDPDYRGINGRVLTQYQNLISKEDVFSDGFFVPENVYIIATMNDIDRSVESMDFAIRRRFSFVDVRVLEKIAQDKYKISSSQENILNSANFSSDDCQTVKDKFVALNKAIIKFNGLGEDYQIGAAYFKNIDKDSDGNLNFEELWNYRLKPLLKEYLRGRKDLEEGLLDLKKAFDGNANTTLTDQESE